MSLTCKMYLWPVMMERKLEPTSYPCTSKLWIHSCYTPMCQSYGSSVTPSLVSGVLEARPISASRWKTVICGPSWISSWRTPPLTTNGWRDRILQLYGPAEIRHFKYNHCRLKAITENIVKYLMKVKHQTHHCEPGFEEYVFLPTQPTLSSWIWLLLMWKFWCMQRFQYRTWIQHSHNNECP